ncbi:MAG: MMPL family transporter [Thermoleophilaceae bacterium]
MSGPRTKWIVVGVWIALAVVLGSVGMMKLPDRVDDQVGTSAANPGDTQSAQLADTLRERFEGGETFLTLVVYRREGGLTEADRQVLLRDAAAAAELEGVGPPTTPFGPEGRPELASPGGEVAFTALPLLAPKAEDRTETLDELRELTGEGSGGLEVRVTGPGALQSDISTALEAADAPLIALTALFVLTLLLLIYRSPIVALLPLLVVGVSLAIAQGLIYLYAEAADATVDRTALSLLAVLVFGAGTDYCLLLVSRYTSALRRYEDKHAAMASAFPGASPAIAASGITVAAALLTALVATLESNQILGPVNAIGILVVLAASLTLLPALLTIAGRRGFWPSRGAVEVPPEAAERPQPQLLPGLGPLPEGLRTSAESAGVVGEREGIWGRIGARVVRRPVVAVAVSAALLGAGALGLLGYGLEVDQIDEFREDTASTEGYDLLRTGFPEGALVPTNVLVDNEDGPPDAAVAQLRSEIGEIEGVAAVSEIQRRSRDGQAATFFVTFADDPYGDPALDRVEQIRSEVLADAPPGVRALAGDGTAARLDYRDAGAADQKRIVPLVLLVIFITLVLLLRALVAPLFLLATVVASFFAALGISLVAFNVLLGEFAVDPAYVLFSFIFLVALGVDYNIFLMSAVREEVPEHGTREAILRAIRSTGPVITSAGLILAGTFAVLTTLPLEVLLQIGFTVALGVLLDTFLVRTVTVPAIAWLLDERTWWPSRPAGRR